MVEASRYQDLANNRTSVLIPSQLPEFIQFNYPNFVAFIEAYMEWMELPGNLTNMQKNFPNFLDIDYVVENSLTDFINAFSEMYLSDIPTNVLANKALLIKHIKNFYSSRGTNKSYKFLFQILFNEDVELFTTQQQILRASDGKWYQPYIIRIETANSLNLWVDSQISGQNSFASAIVESAATNLQQGIFYDELTLSNLTKSFLPGEIITAIAPSNSEIMLYGSVLGIVPGINVINGGHRYNVGDLAIITGGGGINAAAEVSSVSTGSLTSIGVAVGGAAYQTFPNWKIEVSGSATPVNAVIAIIDTTGTVAPNYYLIDDDTLQPNYNVTLANIGFNSRIVDVSHYVTYANCGPIEIVAVLDGGSGINSTPTISITQNTLIGNTNSAIMNFGSIDGYTINNGGLNYAVNDAIIVIDTTSRGTSGAGRITSVNANGSITSTIVDLPVVPGWANVVAGNNQVIGFNTKFTKTLWANDNPTATGSGTRIVINNEHHMVMNIASDTLLNVSTNFTTSANLQPIRLDGYMVGGYGYNKSDFPGGVICQIQTLTGSGGSVSPMSIAGNDAILTSVAGTYGQIQAFKMLNVGQGYISPPNISMANSGDGTAIATAEFISGLFQYPGYWLNNDGKISSNRYLQDPVKYNLYSYTITSKVAVNAYFNLVYKILNPAGSNMLGVTRLCPVTVGTSVPVGIISYVSIPTQNNFILNISFLNGFNLLG